MSNDIKVTVAAVIERDGRFLIVEEQTDDGIRLNQPAGHLEPDESIVSGARRETLEETACHFEPEALVGIYRWCYPRTGVVYVRFAFTGKLGQHETQRPLDEGILRAVWLTAEELRSQADRHRSPLVLRCIDDYLMGRRFPLDLLADLE